MRKIWLVAAISLIIYPTLFAQNIAINSTGVVPVASAMLDISSTTTGLLIPRLALSATNLVSPVTAPATSLLVYNTATAGSSPNNVVPGYYYWSSTAWVAVASSSTTWGITGNTGTTAGTNFLGTTDANDLVFRTNNTEKMRLFAGAGNLAIGASSLDATYPEKLLIDAGITTSVNALYARGTINNYFQLNVRNLSNGTQASSDLVATANNGSETTFFVDLGINGSGYLYQSGNPIETGKLNDGYLISSGNDFYILNNNPAKDMLFLTGGTALTNERMRILSNGKVGIGNSAPTEILDITGNLKLSGALMPAGDPGTSGFVLTSAGAGAPPTWINAFASLGGISWALNGNSVGSIKTLGTIDNFSLPFITDNIERMRILSTGNVGIGNSTPNSTLSLTGSLAMEFRSGTGAYTVLATDYVVINTGVAATWTLPLATSCSGRIYRLVNQGTGNITLTQNVTTANVTTTATLPFAVGTGNFEIISDGTVWRKIN